MTNANTPEENSSPADLWAEIHRLRAAIAGPTPYATWKDCALDWKLKHQSLQSKCAELERLLKIANGAAIETASLNESQARRIADDAKALKIEREIANKADADRARLQREIAALKRPSEPRGTFACPVCMKDTPHGHPGLEDQGERRRWIGVDFDGTLAYDAYDRTDPYELGEPIMPMVNRVKDWIARGYEVRILTARMCKISYTAMRSRDLARMEDELHAWCKQHLGVMLKCTNEKDGLMEVLWDDRAVRVIRDTGSPHHETTRHQPINPFGVTFHSNDCAAVSDQPGNCNCSARELDQPETEARE